MHHHFSSSLFKKHGLFAGALLLSLLSAGTRSGAQTPQITATSPDGHCGPGSVLLSATASAGADIRWYDSVSGGSLVDTGSDYTTPLLTVSTDYYVAARQLGGTETIPAPVPAAADTVATTALFTSYAGLFGQKMNVISPVRIDSVEVFVMDSIAGPASIQIKIKNIATDSEVTGPVYDFTAATSISSASVPVNIILEPGEYAVGMTYTGLSNGAYDTASIAYPYTAPSGAVSVERMVAYNTPSFNPPFLSTTYSFFYSWQITDILESTRTAVTATISDSVIAAVSAVPDTVFCEGDSIMLLAVSGTGYHYLWQKDQMPLTAADTGFYYAHAGGNFSLVVSRDYCSDTSGSIFLHMLPAPVPVIIKNDLTLSTGSYSSYQWLKDGVAIPGATASAYTVTETGAYAVRVTNEDGCSGTSEAYTIDSIPTGITGLSAVPARLELYPNPASGRIHCPLPGQANLEIYDTDGRLRIRTQQEDTDVSGLKPGIYFARVLDKNGLQTGSIKFRKQ